MKSKNKTKTLPELRECYLANRPIAIDLFSGVGGLSLGLELAGFAITSHAEIDETAARYAEYNFPLTRTLGGAETGDIRRISGKNLIVDVPKGTEIALIAGGPPCQGFSFAGKKDRTDPLNDLVLEMTRIILELKPMSFLIENVPGIKSGDVWQLDEAIKRLKKVYRLSEPNTLFAPDFGVPQTRKRVFVLGIRRDIGTTPEHPSPTHLPPGCEQTLFSPSSLTPTASEALGDLPNVDVYAHLVNGDEVKYSCAPKNEFQRIMRSPSILAKRRGYSVSWDEVTCTNCRRTQHGEDLTMRLSALGPGQADGGSGIRRLEPDGLGTTIRAGTTSERGSWSAPRPCHYEYARVLTTRECARLQTFPDWFRFHPVKWHGNRQVGNAVPVFLAEAVGKALFSQLGLKGISSDIPAIERDENLVKKDIEKAESARFDIKNISHKVTGTRKPGNAPRNKTRPSNP